jgi:antitoxin (DNA-binding transcriptional repressor) of toxin-antitoxin stability system
VKAVGEGTLDIEEFIRRVASGEEVTVARQQGKIWVDVVLPEAEFETERPVGGEPGTQ